MGACSSKPKTTEFEGSLEPRKPTDVPADQPHETERSLENLADDHGKEPLLKAGEGQGEGAADASTEAVHTTREVDGGKDDGPLKEVPLSSAEGTSAAQSDVLGEKETVNKEANEEVEQKESKGNRVADEVVQKDDAGSAVADIARENKEGALDKVNESVIDEAKTCEDKAVVSEETGGSQGDASYVDKAVALDEVKSSEVPETPGKRNLIVPEEESSSVLHSIESAGIESPIIGVVQPAELMKEEDVSKSVATEPEKDGESVMLLVEDSQEDSKVTGKSLAREVGDEDGHAPATEDVLELAGEASSEVNKAPSVEVIAPASLVEILPLVSAEADPLKDGEEGTSQPQGDALDDAVVYVSPATTKSQIDVEDYPTDTKSRVLLDESDVIHNEEKSHANEAMKMETPQISENINPEVSSIEPKTEDTSKDSIKEKGGLIVGEMGASNGHALATEEAIEAGSPKGTSGESAPEREDKTEPLQGPTGELGKEAAQKRLVEHAVSGDIAFEDASDAPLKLEASNSIEPGQVPS